MELFGYQNEAVDFIGHTRKAYIALDMGMGKTITSLSAGKELAKKNILVIAEKNEIVNSENFRKEVKLLGDRWDYVNLRESDVPPPPADGGDMRFVCGINPDGLKKIPLKQILGSFDFVIIDEATMAKTTTTARFRLVRKVCDMMPYVVLLSGTPMMNGASELWSPLLLLEHPMIGEGKAEDRKAFEKIFAGGCMKQMKKLPEGMTVKEGYAHPRYRHTHFQWWAKGANRVRELRWLLRDKFFIMQKGQTDVFKKKTRTTENVPMTLEWLAEYTQAWDEYFATQQKTRSKKTIENITELRNLIENGKMYQVNSKWKARTVAMRAVQMAKEHRVVIFSLFIETEEVLKAELTRYGVAWRTFDDIKEWKLGNEPVLLGRIKAHGKGGNVPEASMVVMVDMDFVPANNLQAENRIDRPDQKRDMKMVYYITEGDDVIDAHVRNIVKDKARKIEEFMRPFTEEELKEMPAKIVELRAKYPRECARLGI